MDHELDLSFWMFRSWAPHTPSRLSEVSTTTTTTTIIIIIIVVVIINVFGLRLVSNS